LETHEELSAGGVVYRRTGHGVEYLVGEQIDWRTKARTVRLPKGHLDEGETLEQAALREVEEETGRIARVETLLGEHRYAFDAPAHHGRPSGHIEKRVVFYLMEDQGAHAGGRDEEMERILWLDAEAARTRLTFENEQALIHRAEAHLAGG